MQNFNFLYFEKCSTSCCNYWIINGFDCICIFSYWCTTYRYVPIPRLETKSHLIPVLIWNNNIRAPDHPAHLLDLHSAQFIRFMVMFPKSFFFFNSQSILVCIFKNEIIKIKYKFILFIIRNFLHVVEETECLKVYLIQYLTIKIRNINISWIFSTYFPGNIF